MKIFAITAAAFLIAVPCVHATTTSSRLKPPAEQTNPADTARIQGLLQQAVEKAQANDLAGAKGDLVLITQSPAFASQPAEIRYWTYVMLSACDRDLNQNEEAYDYIVKAGQAAPAMRDANYWLPMVSLSWQLEKDADMVEAVTRLVQDYPEDARNLSTSAIYSALRKARDMPDGAAKRLTILESLRRIDYKSDHIYAGEEDLWSDLFELYAERGDDARARDILTGLKHPASLMALYIDKRYQRFVDTSQVAIQYASAQTAAVAEARRMTAEHPRDIEGVLYLAFNLDDTGQRDEALKLLDDVLAKVAAAPADAPAFDDIDDQLHWVASARGGLLHRLGRDDDWLASQIRSRDESLRADQDTVSQRINLGDVYYALGRPKDALEAVSTIRKAHDASPYGLMAAEEVRVCAYYQLDDKDELATSLGYMRDHARDGYGPLRSALLCVGDEDGLAKLLIAQLDDPDTRLSALTDLQIYLPYPHQTRIEAEQSGHFKAVRDRADVRAVVDKYGVILSWPTWSQGN